jgi:hypothetical protein
MIFFVHEKCTLSRTYISDYKIYFQNYLEDLLFSWLFSMEAFRFGLLGRHFQLVCDTEVPTSTWNSRLFLTKVGFLRGTQGFGSARIRVGFGSWIRIRIRVKSWIRIHIISFRGSKWSRGVPCTFKMEPWRVFVGQWSHIRITLMRSRIRIRIKVIRIRRKPCRYKYSKRGQGW